MELHKAIKDIVSQRGERMVSDAQIINFLLDYQAFKEKPATKLILRDIINSGYANEILSLKSHQSGWQTAFLKYEREFVDSCGYKEELVAYVFESIAYGIGLNISSEEPSIRQNIDIDSFFDINSESEKKSVNRPNQVEQQTNVSPTDLYTIALTFYNEGKYIQAKTFIEKSISQYSVADIPAIQYKLNGDINMKLGCYEEAINDYNNCFKSKAKESKLTIDALRESLKQHRIMGYENSFFCYYLCLYSIDKIDKKDWYRIVKDEAMCGINDAIIYCVNNAINPMDKHINVFFKDTNLLKHNDWIYSDGTFAHELNKRKNIVAKVKLAETTEFEKSHGWTHGYIIPARNNDKSDIYISEMWSSKFEDLPFPHSHYTEDDISHWGDLKTIESEQYISINDFNNFPAFNAVHNFPLRIPIKGMSPWFLPSIHWFKRFSECSWGKDCWTSSQANTSHAICINRYRFYLAKKDQVKYILPIAAF